MNSRVLLTLIVFGIALAVFNTGGMAYFSNIEKSSGSFTAASDLELLCLELGKLEYDEGDGLFHVEEDDDNDQNLGENRFLLVSDDDIGAEVTLRIIATETKVEDGKVEVLMFDFVVESGRPICMVDVKAATDLGNYTFDCVYEGEDIATTSYDESPQHGISYIKFYYCTEYF